MDSLRTIAARQAGVVAAHQLRACGITRHAVEWRVGTHWQRVWPRVYAVFTGPVPPLARCWAAVLYAGHGATLSHGAAAYLLGWGEWPGVVDVTIPEERRVSRQPGLRVHRSSTLDDRQLRRRQRLPVTSVERTVVDLASASPARAYAVIAEAVQTGRTTPKRLLAALDAGGASLPGRREAAQTLADLTGGTRSELEALCLRALRRAGLPEPARDYVVMAGGARRRLDLAYPAYRIAIECDGRLFHVLGEHWERDLTRQNALATNGWLVLRFSGRQLREHPERVAACVAAALAPRARPSS